MIMASKPSTPIVSAPVSVSSTLGDNESVLKKIVASEVEKASLVKM